MSEYDVIVVGGGSAGTSAASAATAAGARTLLLNRGELGGLCILRGCMPTKAMLASAHAMHEPRHAESLGVRLEGRMVADFPRIMERKQAQVLRFQRAKIRSVESQDYEVRSGEARFVRGGVELDGELLHARSYVIATGSVPWTLPVPGIEDVPVWSSDDVMRLTEQPEALVVQGAGPIGLELAQFFARIGTRVLLVNRSPLLWRFDADCGEELSRALTDEGLELAVPGHIERLRPEGAGLVARIVSGDEAREFRADALLMAAGRRAALHDLGLDHLDLEPGVAGLEHDAFMCTSNREVYVAGDATGQHQILHLANQEGAVAGHNAAGGQPRRRMDYRLKMSVVFSDPPFAQIGMTETEALECGHDVATGCIRFPETGRAITMETRYGAWKLVTDRGSGEILGSSILGPRADDLLHLISILMHGRVPVDRVPDMPWYHPTLSEVLLSLARDAIAQRTDRGPASCDPTAP